MKAPRALTWGSGGSQNSSGVDSSGGWLRLGIFQRNAASHSVGTQGTSSGATVSKGLGGAQSLSRLAFSQTCHSSCFREAASDPGIDLQKHVKPACFCLAGVLGPVARVFKGFNNCAIHLSYFYSSEAPLSKNISSLAKPSFH